MDGIIGLGLLAIVVILIGSVGGLLAIGRCSALEQDLRKLRQRLEQLEARLAAGAPGVTASAQTPVQTPAQSPALADTALPSPQVAVAPPEPSTWSSPVAPPTLISPDNTPTAPDAPSALVAAPVSEPPLKPSSKSDALRFEQAVASRWLVWVGGLALALGAVFLVKLGIDEGLFGPLARVCAGLLLGVGLVVGSELVRRRSAPVVDGKPDYVPAALAGGGVVAGYASLLAAFDRYQLLPAVPTFLLLALVSLVALLLALRQGPLLAVLGLFGGYLVPVLVSTGNGNLPGLLGYVALISVAGLLLQSRVQRRWLWWGTVIAHGLWLLLALTLYDGQQVFLFGYLLASLYLFSALPALGWRWQHRFWHWPLHWLRCRSAVVDVHWIWLLGGLLWCGWMHWLQLPLPGWMALGGMLLAAAWLAWRSPALMLLPLWCGLLLVLATLAGSGHWGDWLDAGRPALTASAVWALWR
ncbi:MAG: DUF2339 domain-containing protein, partial [Aeromonadaceae bacterium]